MTLTKPNDVKDLLHYLNYPEHLGRADAARLAAIAERIGPDGRVPMDLAMAWAACCKTGAAQASLRQLRRNLRLAAAKAGLGLSLESDGKTRTPTSQRHLWFAYVPGWDYSSLPWRRT